MNVEKNTETLNRQQAQPLNDPITGFEMDPEAEFRNLKWRGQGEAIL